MSSLTPVTRELAIVDWLPLQEIYRRVADRVGLSEAAKAERTPSARQPVYWNRIAWAIARSKGADLLWQPARATYQLTEEGRRRATSTFARTSYEETQRAHRTHVRLIDDRELARLMVRHNIGVVVERQFPIKRVNLEDFVAGEL